MSTEQDFNSAQSGELKVVEAEIDQCPVCGEKDYITVDNKTGAIVCQSCGYDNSMSPQFKSAPLNL